MSNVEQTGASKKVETESNVSSPPRKGRRRAAAARVHTLGIVEAALRLAKDRGVEEATSGDVLGWFEEIGYRANTGLPTRNSVYVSLHRAALNSDPRISREEGGLFRFHHEPT